MTQVEGPPVSSWSFAIGLRTAVHDLLMQPGFHSEWRGDIRISSVSSAAGATAKIAAVVQTGGGFSVMAEEAPLRKTAKIAMDGQLLPCRELSKSHTSSPLDMAGLPEMAQVLAVYHTGFVVLRNRGIANFLKKIIPQDATAVLEGAPRGGNVGRN